MTLNIDFEYLLIITIIELITRECYGREALLLLSVIGLAQCSLFALAQMARRALPQYKFIIAQAS